MTSLIEINNSSIQQILRLKKQKKKIVLCHGAFDLIHPGHLAHFEQSKKFGEILIVTITADRFIKKGIHNPYFDQLTRLNNLKQLKIVDFCFVVNETSAVSAIELIKPNFYCKGVEYKTAKNDQNLKKEIKAVNKVKGRIKYIGSQIKSSSELISKNFFQIQDSNLKSKIKYLSKIDINSELNKMRNTKVLVIGETILDEYIEVRTKGISPKSSTISCVKKKSTMMPGGALATFKFVSSITKNSKFISILNEELYSKYKKKLEIPNDIITSKKFPKIIKSRLIEDIGNQVIKKIFTINDYDEKALDRIDENKIINKIKTNAKKFDIIIVQNFGHNFFI